MKRIMFVCHGNICRSPLAEFVMKDIVSKAGREKDFYIASAGTSFEESGNPVYPPIKEIMLRHGIPFTERRAVRLRADDYEKFDLFVIMDKNNERNTLRIFGDDPQGKIKMLLSFAGVDRNVADPWYYGNFEQTYSDIFAGCTALMKYFNKREEKQCKG